MPGKVVGTSLNFGFPGTYSRTSYAIVRTLPVADDSDIINFGDPLVIKPDGTVQKLVGADYMAKDFAGIAAREVKGATIYPNQDIAGYNANEPCSVFQIGSITVEVSAGDPKANGPVYLDKTTGSFVAVSGDDTIELTNCRYATSKDVNNVAELVILTRQGA